MYYNPYLSGWTRINISDDNYAKPVPQMYLQQNSFLEAS